MLDGSSSDSDAPPEALPSSSSAAAASGGHAYGGYQPPKRANKNRPSEQTTRRPVSTFRVAPGLSEGGSAAAPRKRKSVDPRFFDPRSASAAEFDEQKWRQSYDFVFEQQKQEVADMKQQLADSAKASRRAKQRGGGAKRQRVRGRVLDEDSTNTLKLEIDRAQNRVIADERKQKRQEVAAAVRQEEVQAVKEGKKPFFAKKSVLRERELIAQYEELKKRGKGALDKFLEKRRRKLDAKQHKRVPGGAPAGGAWAA